MATIHADDQPPFSEAAAEPRVALASAFPLRVDQVRKDHPRSQTRLLDLPPEILSNIVELVDSSSFGSLALVNRYCRQLARPRQFASFRFGFTPASHQMLNLLLQEGRQRRSPAHASKAQYGYLGSCIRRMMVKSNRERPARYMYVDGHKGREEESEYMAYMKRLQFVIASRSILPNLEYLDWGKEEEMPPSSFFNSLALSNIQHLKICGIPIDAELDIGLDCLNWPLRTLHMEVDWRKKKVSDVLLGSEMSPLCTSLLRQCASSVETLMWSSNKTSQIKEDPQSFATDTFDFPHFPKLTVLEIREVNFPESSVFDALLASPLSVLVTNHEVGSNVEDSLVKRGCIKSLKTFVWRPFKVPHGCSFDFLQANPQISKLNFISPIPPDVLESQLLPLLCKSFEALTSLSLTWKGNSIPEAALDIISGLHTLEQLHLSSGTPAGWRRDWAIDHDSMRNHLSQLPHLRRIAFSRDTYRLVPSDDPSQGTYYTQTNRLIPEIVRELESMGDHNVDFVNLNQYVATRWEEKHRDRMNAEADKYALSMPKLEWIFMGQYPISITESHGSTGVTRHAQILTEKRSDKITFLRRMFGWDGVDA
jgi:hypothetical protein